MNTIVYIVCSLLIIAVVSKLVDSTEKKLPEELTEGNRFNIFKTIILTVVSGLLFWLFRVIFE